MNWLLIVVCVILIWNTIRGYRRGFLAELYGLVATILALLLAAVLVVKLGEAEGFGILSNVILFILGFLIIRFLLGLVNRLLVKVSHIPVLGFINRLVGACVGLSCGMLLVFLLLSFFRLIEGTAIGNSAAACIAQSAFLSAVSAGNILWKYIAALIG